MQSFLTVTRLKQRLGLDGVALSATDETRLAAAVRAAESAISARTGRRYAPLRGTARTPIYRYGDGDTLVLPADLLSLEALSIDGAAVALGDVELVGGVLIRRTDGELFAPGEAAITGLWAYHNAPESAWRSSATSLTTAINTTSTTLTVIDTTGADAEGESPRLMPGQLIRVGAELMRVVSTTASAMIVRRAVNGTAAASHSSGAPVETFATDPSAASLGYRWAAWLYRENDGDAFRVIPDALNDDLRRLVRVGV